MYHLETRLENEVQFVIKCLLKRIDTVFRRKVRRIVIRTTQTQFHVEYFHKVVVVEDIYQI